MNKGVHMIKLEITEQQLTALGSKKLADVIKLIGVVTYLKEQHIELTAFLDKFLTNEPLDIIYNGGSTPGAQRRIVPQSIKEDGSFRAFCIDSDSSKAFKLNKVELV
jgi:hypothetical protein